jgi:hypothetical protein
MIKKYLEDGGNLLIIKGSQGESKINKNLNNIIKDYGISFTGDSIDNDALTVNFNDGKLIKIDGNNDYLPLKISYPFGQSLDVDQKNSCINTLSTDFPKKKIFIRNERI